MAISEIITVEAPSEFNAQKIVVLWAPMQLPETTIANQSFLKTGFLNASQVDVFSEVFSMGGAVEINRLRLGHTPNKLETHTRKRKMSLCESFGTTFCSLHTEYGPAIFPSVLQIQRLEFRPGASHSCQGRQARSSTGITGSSP